MSRFHTTVVVIVAVVAAAEVIVLSLWHLRRGPPCSQQKPEREPDCVTSRGATVRASNCPKYTHRERRSHVVTRSHLSRSFYLISIRLTSNDRILSTLNSFHRIPGYLGISLSRFTLLRILQCCFIACDMITCHVITWHVYQIPRYCKLLYHVLYATLSRIACEVRPNDHFVALSPS